MRRILWMVLLASASAQVNPFVAANAGVLNRLGYKGQTFGGGGGVEVTTSYFRAVTEFVWSSAPKVDTGDGRTERAEGSVYAGRPFQFGVGVRYTRLVTSQYAKGAARPYPAFAWRARTHTLTIAYLLGVLDKQNALAGPDVAFELRRGKWGVLFTGGAYRFHDTRVAGQTYSTPAPYHWGAAQGLSVRRYF